MSTSWCTCLLWCVTFLGMCKSYTGFHTCAGVYAGVYASSHACAVIYASSHACADFYAGVYAGFHACAEINHAVGGSRGRDSGRTKPVCPSETILLRSDHSLPSSPVSGPKLQSKWHLFSLSSPFMPNISSHNFSGIKHKSMIITKSRKYLRLQKRVKPGSKDLLRVSLKGKRRTNLLYLYPQAHSL